MVGAGAADSGALEAAVVPSLAAMALTLARAEVKSILAGGAPGASGASEGMMWSVMEGWDEIDEVRSVDEQEKRFLNSTFLFVISQAKSKAHVT